MSYFNDQCFLGLLIPVQLLPVLYLAGLYFLPKQLRQENQHRQKLSTDDGLDMEDVHQPGYHDRE